MAFVFDPSIWKVAYTHLPYRSIISHFFAKINGEAIVYHQFRRNCISSATCCGISSRASVYIIRRKAVYHQAAENAPSVMIYAKGDDIHACAWWYAKPAAWIKKFRERSSRNFLAAAQGFEPRKWRSQSPLPYRLATPLRCIFCSHCVVRCIL